MLEAWSNRRRSARMKINRTGVTRIVFVLKNHVVKVPTPFNGWYNFIQGIIANMVERNTWRFNSGIYESGHSHLLCPVTWVSWGGILLVMVKAKTIPFDAEIDKSEHKKHFPGDDHNHNYGIIDNRVVKIDYGNI